MTKQSLNAVFSRPAPALLFALFILSGCAGTPTETRYDTNTRMYSTTESGVKSRVDQYDNSTARYTTGKDEGTESYSALQGGVKSTVGPYHDATALYTLRQGGSSVPFSEAIRASRVPRQESGQKEMTAGNQADTPPMILELSDVLFEFDKWVIKDSFVSVLDQWVDYFKNHPSVKVEIYGYTDSTGTVSYNQSLSEKRAQAVVNYLVERGVDSSRLTARGFGESQPAAPNSTKKGRQKNRRVEMKF